MLLQLTETDYYMYFIIIYMVNTLQGTVTSQVDIIQEIQTFWVTQSLKWVDAADKEK